MLFSTQKNNMNKQMVMKLKISQANE